MGRPKKNDVLRPVAIDLFCGVGGMSLGFEQAGFDVLLGVDADGHHVAAHARNFPHSLALCKSVVDLDAEIIYSLLGGKRPIDLVFGGPPCQGFSNMGLRDSGDPRNTLVDQFCRLVAELQPKAFVMENVPGMMSGATRSILDRAVAFLEGAGYVIRKPIQLLDAADFGVPQKRKRLFVLGARMDLTVVVPYPSGPGAGQPPRPTVWEAIGDLPRVEDHEHLFTRNEVEYDRAPESAYAKVARGHADDPSDLGYPRKWRSEICTGCLRIRHTPKAVALYAATAPGRTVPGHKLPRLDSDGLCPTLRAGSDSTHGSYTAPRPIHPLTPRCITAREAARLHGFPDWFDCYPLKWHAYRQIGNAVCPPVARAIGREVLHALKLAPLKPSVALALGSDFPLPEDRPRTLKRIPHVASYPPVVAHLFGRAFDEKTGKVRRAYFTFADVTAAISATGVNLSWTRPDTFVQEIARSRNVLRILEPCLARGYSIKVAGLRDYIGEFVPVGEAGTVEGKGIIRVESRDLANAVLVNPAAPICMGDARSVAVLLADPSVVSSIWPGQSVRLEIEPSTIDGSGGFSSAYRLRNGKGIVGRGFLRVSAPGTPPPLERIARLAVSANATEGVVLVPLTSKHVLVARLTNCRKAPREVMRKVFELANGSSPVF